MATEKIGCNFTSDMRLYGLANADWYTDADIKELTELEQKPLI